MILPLKWSRRSVYEWIVLKETSQLDSDLEFDRD